MSSKLSHTLVFLASALGVCVLGGSAQVPVSYPVSRPNDPQSAQTENVWTKVLKTTPADANDTIEGDDDFRSLLFRVAYFI